MALVHCTLGNQEPQKPTEKQVRPQSTFLAAAPESTQPETIHQSAPIQIAEPPPVMMPIPEPTDFPVLLDQAKIVIDISEQQLDLYKGKQAIKAGFKLQIRHW